MKSAGQKLEQLEGLLGTTDVSAWETSFIRRNVDLYRFNNKSTSTMSGNVLEKIDEIWSKHFA